MSSEATRGGQAPPTSRRDLWWLYPSNVVIWLTLFGLYSFWTIVFFHSDRYHQYLSPFYSPQIAIGRVPFSPALLIFLIPLGFRATCYYYRKAYYRSFFQDPPACAIREPEVAASLSPTGRKTSYRGESRFPFILNNLHRYFLYFALVFIVVLWIDVFRAFQYHGHWGFGLGTALMLINIIFLTLYTFSCHSLRHLIGGGMDCFSCHIAGPQRHRLWGLSSRINPSHPTWAWMSLFSLILTDLYIRLLQFGVLHDPHLGF